MPDKYQCDCGFDHDQDAYFVYSDDDITDDDEDDYSEDYDDESHSNSDSDSESGEEEVDPTPRCAQCHKTADQTRELVLRLCTLCKTAHYCTRKCQKTHWIHHKEFCDSVYKMTELLKSSNYPPGLHDDLQENLDRFKLECKSWPVAKTGPGEPPGPTPPATSKILYMRSMGDKPPKRSRPPKPTVIAATAATAAATPAKAATPLTKAAAATTTRTATAATKVSTPATKTAAPAPAKAAASSTTKATPASSAKSTTPAKPVTPVSTTAKPVTPITKAAKTAVNLTPPSSNGNVKFTTPTTSPIKIGNDASGAPVMTNSSKSPLFVKEPGQEVISKGLKKHIDKPYHHLNSKTWLHDRPEEDVYKLLIDCFRMRQHDDFTTEGLKDKDGLYGGASHSQAGFKRFLVKAEARQDLLPQWWFMGKAAANCLRMGGGLGAAGTEWSSLTRKVDKAAIIDHYANPEMPMQLRMLGEQIYLRGPAGQSGVPMIKRKLESEGMYDLTLDMTRLTPK